jgi:hypothetical protein
MPAQMTRYLRMEIILECSSTGAAKGEYGSMDGLDKRASAPFLGLLAPVSQL